MKAIVTGAAGFVGSHLCERLLKDGLDVVGVDNFITGQKKNLEYLKSPRFQFIEHDVIKPLPEQIKADWILHFASPASPPFYLKHPLETLRVNSEGSMHLLELAKKTGAKFFLASTSECYGDPQISPQPETYWGNVNPNGPRSVYDEAKRYAEAITMCFHRDYGVDTRIIRIFNTYGPRMDPYDGRVVSNFICQALRGDEITVYGDGSQTRSFQYVSDLIEGIRKLMEVKYHDPVNLGNLYEFTIKDFAELIKKTMSSKVSIKYEPLPADDPKQRRPDITLAGKLLGWKPVVSLEEGLAKTIEFFKTCKL